jgi:methionyl-tRNA formyltransferase
VLADRPTAAMTVVFFTIADSLYLTDFFDRVLSDAEQTVGAVFLVPALYKGQGRLAAAWRFVSTFGVRAFVRLASRELTASLRGHSIAKVCRAHGVACERVRDVNASEFRARLASMQPDVIVSVGCPQIFERELIELPRKACLNVHGSVLPHYRGVLPSFWMLANDEKEAGVSVHLVNDRIDAGDVCGQRVFEIPANESLDGLLRRSKEIAADLVVEVLANVEEDRLQRRPIDLKEGSYYTWPDRQARRRLEAAGHRLW